MSLTIENTQQISAEIYAEREDGERQHIAAMSFSYRPGKRFGLSLEIMNEAAAASEGEAVKGQVAAFIEHAFALAAAADLPVPAPTDREQ